MSAELDQAVDLEVVGDLGRVVVGQIEEDDAAHGGVLARRLEHGVADDPVPRGISSQSSRSSAAGCSPHTHAVVHDVVRPRTPTDEISRPVSALKVDDLPDPVHPRSRPRCGRARAEVGDRPARRPSRPGEDGSVEPAATSLHCLFEAGESRAQICASGDQLLGPLQQRRHLLPRRRVGVSTAASSLWGTPSRVAGAARQAAEGPRALTQDCRWGTAEDCAEDCAANRRSSTRRAASRRVSAAPGCRARASRRST